MVSALALAEMVGNLGIVYESEWTFCHCDYNHSPYVGFRKVFDGAMTSPTVALSSGIVNAINVST